MADNPDPPEINPTIPIPPPPQNIVIHQDHSSLPLTVILDETNFPLWSQLMDMRIGARNKTGFLTGDNPRPDPGDPSLESWITDNKRVKSWLIDSMSPNLMKRFIRLETACEIWEAAAKTFYDGSDESCLFDLNQRSFTTKQSGRPLATYYNELLAIFQEIDHRSASSASVADLVHQHSLASGSTSFLLVSIRSSNMSMVKYYAKTPSLIWKDLMRMSDEIINNGRR